MARRCSPTRMALGTDDSGLLRIGHLDAGQEMPQVVSALSHVFLSEPSSSVSQIAPIQILRR